MKKSRLDLIVLEKGLFESRQAAQAAIMTGAVLVNGQKVTKPGQNIAIDANVSLIPGFSIQRFVSRGGLKLEKALIEFDCDVNERVCIDLGASTGGFTDCLLQHGARRVYAIDVGYGQLDWSIRSNEKVVVLERVNARHLLPETLYRNDGENESGSERATLLVADLSFISLSKILAAAKNLVDPINSEFICLIKPQFEVGRAMISKGGVVRSKEGHLNSIETVLSAAKELALYPRALTFSPITGPAGNIEYLILLSNCLPAVALQHEQIVECALTALQKKGSTNAGGQTSEASSDEAVNSDNEGD